MRVIIFRYQHADDADITARHTDTSKCRMYHHWLPRSHPLADGRDEEFQSSESSRTGRNMHQELMEWYSTTDPKSGAAAENGYFGEARRWFHHFPLDLGDLQR